MILKEVKWLNYFNINGIVLYPFVLVIDKGNERLVRHEMIHVAQIKELGVIKFYIEYLIEWIKKGYTNNRFEVEARRYQYDPYYLKNRKSYKRRK